MARQIIATGTTANDGTGDPLRTGSNRPSWRDGPAHALIDNDIPAATSSAETNETTPDLVFILHLLIPVVLDHVFDAVRLRLRY